MDEFRVEVINVGEEARGPKEDDGGNLNGQNTDQVEESVTASVVPSSIQVRERVFEAFVTMDIWG